MNDNSLLVARYYDPDKRREFYAEGFCEEGREEGLKEGLEKGEKKGEKKGIFYIIYP